MGMAQFLLIMGCWVDIMTARREWYPSDWGTRKQKVLERDDYICQNCGHYGGPESMMGVDVDYITPPPEDGTPELQNLWTLCYDCHRSVGYGPPPKSSRYKLFGKILLGTMWGLFALPLAGGLSLDTSMAFSTLYLLLVGPPFLIAWWLSR